MTSTTFIRREIAAIERSGVQVHRFAVRKWSEPLVDPLDVDESARTTYILTDNLPRLLATAVWEAFRHPIRAFLATRTALKLYQRAKRRGVVKHFGYLVQALYVRRAFARLGITHVHAHFSTNAATVALLCRMLGGPAYSFSVHGPDELVDPRAEGLDIKVHYATAVVAISDYCKRRIEAIANVVDTSRIKVIHCGLNLDEYEVAAPVQSSLLVCVGRLCPQKGQVHIPEAVHIVRQSLPDVHVMLIGDGESRQAIELEMERLEVGRQITLVGWQPNTRVQEAIASARALLLPSYAEGLPVVIMEAFAIGRPVVTTRIAGIPELVDESCGWLCEPGDVAGLAQAMVQCLVASPTKLASMGSEGRRRVASDHNLQAIAQQLVATFVRD